MERLQNFVGGEWRASSANEGLKVMNPASAKVLAEVRGMTLEALAELTTGNFRRLFGKAGAVRSVASGVPA